MLAAGERRVALSLPAVCRGMRWVPLSLPALRQDVRRVPQPGRALARYCLAMSAGAERPLEIRSLAMASVPRPTGSSVNIERAPVPHMREVTQKPWYGLHRQRGRKRSATRHRHRPHHSPHGVSGLPYACVRRGLVRSCTETVIREGTGGLVAVVSPEAERRSLVSEAGSSEPPARLRHQNNAVRATPAGRGVSEAGSSEPPAQLRHDSDAGLATATGRGAPEAGSSEPTARYRHPTGGAPELAASYQRCVLPISKPSAKSAP